MNSRTHSVLLTSALLLCLARTPGDAQQSPREGSPRMVGVRALEALIAADDEDLTGLAETRLAPAFVERQGRPGIDRLLAEIRTELRGREMVGLSPLGPTTAEAVFAVDGGEAIVVLDVEEAPPHRLTGLSLTLPERSAIDAADARPASDGAGFDSLDALGRALVQLLESNNFFGAVRAVTTPEWQEKYSHEAREVFEGLRRSLGREVPLAFDRVAGDGGEWHVYLRAGNEPMRFLVIPTAEPPYLLKGIDTLAMPDLSVELASGSSLAETVAGFVEDRFHSDRFSGVVLVARGLEPIVERAWGLADEATGRALDLDTPLNLGSMNKMFTGLAIAQLEARGLLSYDDPISKYLPDYPNEVVRSEVTLHHLLTHTSGIPSYWNEAYDSRKREIDSLAELVTTFQDEPLAAPPGTAFHYSNGGPVLLGLVIEKVTGQSYYDYVREHIYRPAGMTRSDHYRITDSSAGFATGYAQMKDGRPLEANTEMMGLIGSPAGGGYASANDLLRFARALASGVLLSRENLERLWSPQKRGGEEERYGYLWGGTGEGPARWVGHNGGAPGISADFRYFPETGDVVVVLANLSRAAMPVSQWISRLLVETTT